MIFVGLNTLILKCSPVEQGAFFELYYCVRQQCYHIWTENSQTQSSWSDCVILYS